MCDANCEGYIDFIDLQLLLEGFGFSLKRKDVLSLVIRYTGRKDGNILYKDYLSLMKDQFEARAQDPEQQKKMLRESFNLFDVKKSRKDVISLEDFKFRVRQNVMNNL